MILINKVWRVLRLIKISAEIMFRQKQLQPIKIESKKDRYGRSTLVILIALFFITAANEAQAQVRYNYGFSIGTGLYAAEGFGTSFSAALRVNKYFSEGRHFVEGSFGITNFESEVLKAIGNTQFFEHNRLMSFEFLYGYDPKMWTSLPYFTMGVASINQGGQSRFAGILGIGNRIYFDTLFGSNKMGLRYDLRDHIFKQSYNSSKEFFTHNLNLSLNLEFFF
jgi:hypothetical protein